MYKYLSYSGFINKKLKPFIQSNFYKKLKTKKYFKHDFDIIDCNNKFSN